MLHRDKSEQETTLTAYRYDLPAYFDPTSGSLLIDVVAATMMRDPLVGTVEKPKAAWVRAVEELFLNGKLEQVTILTAYR